MCPYVLESEGLRLKLFVLTFGVIIFIWRSLAKNLMLS